jgi:hypothetical protein
VTCQATKADDAAVVTVEVNAVAANAVAIAMRDRLPMFLSSS